MGNTVPSEVLVETGGPNVEQLAHEKAKGQIPGDAWKTILVSREYGHGMALCVDNGDGVKFFTTQGHDTISEAARAVFKRAKAAATGDNKPYVCGKPWLVPTEEQREWMNAPPEFHAIDLVKGLIRQWVICDAEEEAAGECKRPEPPKNTVTGVRG